MSSKLFDGERASGYLRLRDPVSGELDDRERPAPDLPTDVVEPDPVKGLFARRRRRHTLLLRSHLRQPKTSSRSPADEDKDPTDQSAPRAPIAPLYPTLPTSLSCLFSPSITANKTQSDDVNERSRLPFNSNEPRLS